MPMANNHMKPSWCWHLKKCAIGVVIMTTCRQWVPKRASPNTGMCKLGSAVLIPNSRRKSWRLECCRQADLQEKTVLFAGRFYAVDRRM